MSRPKHLDRSIKGRLSRNSHIETEKRTGRLKLMNSAKMKLKEFAFRFSALARERRAKIVAGYFELNEKTRVLDLGSQDGVHINRVLRGTSVRPENVFIADLDAAALERTREMFGYTGVPISESGPLPFADAMFDLVFCSSVIEHVTVAKKEVWEIEDGEDFKRSSFERQREFADEIRRVGRGYFVQTPNRSFLIESHSWLPLVSFLPRKLLIKTLKFTNKFWIIHTTPDFNLLNGSEMAELFPDAEIVFERYFGLVKSIMAIKAVGDNFVEKQEI